MNVQMESLTEIARAANVRDSLCSAAVAEALLANSPSASVRNPRFYQVAIAMGAGAALLLVAVPRLWPSAAARPEPALLSIGDRVAVLADSESRYSLAHADDVETTLVVEHGDVTARLFKSDTPHRLVLRSGEFLAVATGTTYTMHVDRDDVSITVHEGTVKFETPDGVVQVASGSSWPDDTGYGLASSVRLRALPARALPARALPARALPARALPARALPARALPARALPARALTPTSKPGAASMDLDTGSNPLIATPDETKKVVQLPPRPDLDQSVEPVSKSNRRLWRKLRLLRAQGNFDEAAELCQTIVATRDTVWSPIALVELVRIELGPKANPERVLVLVESMRKDFPNHALVPEVVSLGCQAHAQLGQACPARD